MLRTDVDDERRLGGADAGVVSGLTVGLEGWLSPTGPAGADSVELLESLFTSSGIDCMVGKAFMLSNGPPSRSEGTRSPLPSQWMLAVGSSSHLGNSLSDSLMAFNQTSFSL